MEEIQLNVQTRSEIGRRNIKGIRRNDFVPAIVYGGKQEPPTPIKVERRNYERIMRQHRGQSVIFHLNVMEGGSKLRDYSVILKEEQFHPVQDRIIHIDFHRISLTQRIKVEVPIVAKGDPIGVKFDGGSLDHPLRELDVFCLPKDIPDHITIEVSHLKIGNAIHVKDIVLPEGVITKHDPEAIVFSVVPPMKQVEEKVEEQPAEPELIKKKKEEVPTEEKAEEKEKSKQEG